MNKYVDFDDYDNPVKSYIDDRLFFPIEPYTKKNAVLNVKRSYTQF